MSPRCWPVVGPRDRKEGQMQKLVWERERPSEWLRALKESESGYDDLIRESGTVFVAAHRVASPRCRVSAVSVSVPTLREVQAAALEVLSAGEEPTPLPSPAVMIEECQHAGLEVIEALR